MSTIRPGKRSVVALLASLIVPMLPARAAEDSPPATTRTSKPAGRQKQQSAPADTVPRPSPFIGQKPATPPKPTFTIPAGTKLAVRLDQTLDTKHFRAGDRFQATLDAPVTIRGRVVVPKGTAFEGHVTAAKASGRLRGRGVLGLALDSFGLKGASYPVQTYAEVRSSSGHAKRNVALIGGGAGVGAVVGKISGVGAAIGAGAGAAAGTTTALITGKRHVKLPVETPMVFSLRTNVEVRG